MQRARRSSTVLRPNAWRLQAARGEVIQGQDITFTDRQLHRRKHPITHNILATETIQSPALPLQGVNDVHRSHGLPPSVLSVGHGVSDHILEENFEDSPGLLIDEAGDTLHASSTGQTANGRLGDPLDVVAKHLPVTLGSSLAQSLASLSTAGHFCRVNEEI
nr:histone H4 [Ipomoea batatas]